MHKVESFRIYKNEKKVAGSSQPDHSLSLSVKVGDEWKNFYLSSWKTKEGEAGITGGQGSKEAYTTTAGETYPGFEVYIKPIGVPTKPAEKKSSVDDIAYIPDEGEDVEPEGTDEF